MNNLLDYDWPGNVREKNVIEKAIIVAQNRTITRDDIYLPISRPVLESNGLSTSYHEARARFETKIIKEAPAKARGNQTQAAEILKVSRNFLIRQMKK